MMRFFIIISLVVVGPYESSALEFAGVITGSRKTVFALREESMSPSRWVSLGDSYAGFTVRSYDIAHEVLTLQKGEEVLRLKLPESKVVSAGRSAFVGSVDAISGLEFAYALATSGDEVVAEMVLGYDRQTAKRLNLVRELEIAKEKLSSSQNDVDVMRVGTLTRQLRTESQMEEAFRRRLIEVANERRFSFRFEVRQ